MISTVLPKKWTMHSKERIRISTAMWIQLLILVLMTQTWRFCLPRCIPLHHLTIFLIGTRSNFHLVVYHSLRIEAPKFEMNLTWSMPCTCIFRIMLGYQIIINLLTDPTVTVTATEKGTNGMITHPTRFDHRIQKIIPWPNCF